MPHDFGSGRGRRSRLDGIYRISPHLQSDIEKFTGHIHQADRTSGADQAHELRAALELVEGTPFTGAGNAYT